MIDDGYLDIGIIDTVKDLFFNLIGAIVFSVFGIAIAVIFTSWNIITNIVWAKMVTATLSYQSTILWCRSVYKISSGIASEPICFHRFYGHNDYYNHYTGMVNSRLQQNCCIITKEIESYIYSLKNGTSLIKKSDKTV